MEIKFSNYFSYEIDSIIQFIDSVNNIGAGFRWFLKFEDFLKKELQFPSTHPICKNQTFSKYNLSCLFFNDWTIAFQYNESEVLLVAIVHKSNIVD